MNDRLTMALAVAGGYVLGRTRKTKSAVGIAVTLVSAGVVLAQLARNPRVAQRLLVASARTLGQAAGKLDSVAGRGPAQPFEETYADADADADEDGPEAEEAEGAERAEGAEDAAGAEAAAGEYAAAGERP
ncbi:hypothetical protein [Streptomyces sp. 3N207]|uniref:hypothetical protein n=1 Tax=Streptomyces sp. 3N207 TaxID=3457417 RepID=UPI003FD2F8AC